MVGRTLGTYQILEKVGAGGMGEVFRARDTALGRDVAIKLLPSALASDEESRARLNREARMLAALSHPHIAQLYGLEQTDDGPVLVMEFVAGAGLESLIASGTPVPRALDIARQIADALDAAHARDIVHRDLKPANVKVAADGRVKVLDFGIARPISGAMAGGGQADDLATVTSGDLMTTAGRILGTVTYMSPEQARGHQVDRRTDIWSFGCVLFELYAGRPPFAGDTSSDQIAAILHQEPAWDALPAATPSGVRRLLRWCLEKDVSRRLRDIGDAAPLLSAEADAVEAGVRPTATGANRALVWALGAAVLVLGAATTWLLGTRPGETSAATPPVTFSVPPPAGTVFAYGGIETTDLALSPDGSTLAVLAVGRGERSARIWLHALSRNVATPLEGTEWASSMFWSPDGRSLAFFANGKLKRIDPNGGAAVSICDTPVAIGLSGTWGPTGDILFASVQGDGIYRVPAAGGVPVLQIAPGAGLGGRVFWPRFLPDGRRFLFSTLGEDFEGRVVLGDLDGSWYTLLSAASQVQFVAPNWLVFVREAILVAQRVDLDARTTIGDPVPIAGPVAYSAATAWSNVAASEGGQVVFQSAVDDGHIGWFNESGEETAWVGPSGRYFKVRLSPDASRLLFSRLRPELGTYDLWTTDLGRGTETRLTSSPGMETGEVWLPDASGIVYAAARGAVPNIYRQMFDGGVPEQLISSPRFHFPNDMSPDGRFLVYQQRTEVGNFDLMLMPLANPGAVTPFASTDFHEADARFSPLGNAIAFTSNEDGRLQVYVAPFPAGRKVPVSGDSGTTPRWRRDGRALFYLSGGRLMVVPIDAAGAPGTARSLFETPSWSDFDVAPDGRRFIAVVRDSMASEQPLTMILNWPALGAK